VVGDYNHSATVKSLWWGGRRGRGGNGVLLFLFLERENRKGGKRGEKREYRSSAAFFIFSP